MAVGMLAWAALGLDVLPANGQDSASPLSFATGFAAGHVAADSVDGYWADALIGLGAGALVGAIDSGDQERSGRTRRDLYIRGVAAGGVALLLALAFSEMGTDPSTELLEAQPGDADHRAGFIEGYSSRLGARHRIGAAVATVTFLVAHATAIALTTEADGTTYPLFSIHVPVGP